MNEMSKKISDHKRLQFYIAIKSMSKFYSGFIINGRRDAQKMSGQFLKLLFERRLW